MWHYHGNTEEFGGLFNDWNGRVGVYKYTKQLDGAGMQLIGARFTTTAGNTGPGASINPTPTAGGMPSLDSGSFQDDLGSSRTGGVIDWTGSLILPPYPDFPMQSHYPPLVDSTKTPIVFSQGVYYYFGVRPGKTSFNTFVRMYINEELSETVI